MQLLRSVLTGVVAGIYYGGLLAVTTNSLSTASFILYNNRYFIPLAATGILFIITFIGLGTSFWWGPYLMRKIEGGDAR